jgi:hypothetical protein
MVVVARDGIEPQINLRLTVISAEPGALERAFSLKRAASHPVAMDQGERRWSTGFNELLDVAEVPRKRSPLKFVQVCLIRHNLTGFGKLLEGPLRVQ